METLEVIELECVESKDFDSTNLIITNLVNLLRQDFEYRNNFIEASIFNKKVKLSINNLLVALILIKIKYMLSKSLSIKDLIVIEGNTDIASKINKYINAVIEEYDNHHIQEVNALVADTLEQIADITYSINSFNGSTVNLYDLCKLANENSDVKDMLSYQVDENKQYYDIESDVGAVTTKFINRLKEDKSNCYNYILSSVSRKQFSQAFINVSLKPDLYGNVIPRAVNSSFLRGLRDPIDYFITSIGARKALITNAT